MSGDREATSDQSSVREGAGYDEVYPSGHEPEEDLTWSLKRDPSAHSPTEEEKECEEEEEEEEEGEEEEEDNEEERGDEEKDDEEDVEDDEDGSNEEMVG